METANSRKQSTSALMMKNLSPAANTVCSVVEEW